MSELNLHLRGPESYALARKALAELERLKIWPTPLNFELWLRSTAEPSGDLARAISTLVASGEPITEAVSEALAVEHLAQQHLSDEIRDAGLQLNRELDSVSRAIGAAQKSSEAYGRTLAGASESLAGGEGQEIKRVVESLAAATQRMERENSTLEQQLSASTQELQRVRAHLEQVRREAMTDALTNLWNRKAFDEAVEQACAPGAPAPLTLAIVDIDHFKRFNDTWGHQTGDHVLRFVASVIGRVGREPRVAARYGGEEFAILFPGERAANVVGVLEQMRNEIASRVLKRRSTNDDLGAVTVSAGVAQLHAGESPASLVERADAALYASKRGGRNRVTNPEVDVIAA